MTPSSSCSTSTSSWIVPSSVGSLSSAIPVCPSYGAEALAGGAFASASSVVLGLNRRTPQSEHKLTKHKEELKDETRYISQVPDITGSSLVTSPEGAIYTCP